jgi:hypothetical protein
MWMCGENTLRDTVKLTMTHPGKKQQKLDWSRVFNSRKERLGKRCSKAA